MCTVLLALDVREDAPLIVAANRDEVMGRPTAPFGELLPGVWGGRDLSAGGTWFAVRRDGAMALLTNIRPGALRDDSKKSRGEIVLRLLAQPTAEAMRVEMAKMKPQTYNPFNVLFGTRGDWSFAGSDRPAVVRVSPGLHLLGNTTLDDPDDPKMAALEGLDLRTPSLQQVRDTLVGLLCDALFIDFGGYGTRWSLYYAGPHAPIDSVEIAETSARRSPLVAMALR
jgi:uncharacterized protein with NRDE domain